MNVSDQPQNCFVGLVDILGFKHLFTSNPEGLEPNELTKKIFNTMTGAFVETREYLIKIAEAKGGPVRTARYRRYVFPNDPFYPEPHWQFVRDIAETMRFFSDTIYYYIPIVESEELQAAQIWAMCFVTNYTIKLASLFKRDEQIYQIVMRGGISSGPIIASANGVFCGKPVIDAFELGEAQKWMGAALHPTMNQFISSPPGSSLVGFDKPIYRYNIPLKSTYKQDHKGQLPVYALNWVQNHPAIPDFYPGIEFCCKKRRPLRDDLVGGNLRYYPWGLEVKKRDNTYKFADAIFKEYDNSEEYGLK